MKNFDGFLLALFFALLIIPSTATNVEFLVNRAVYGDVIGKKAVIDGDTIMITGIDYNNLLFYFDNGGVYSQTYINNALQE